MFNFALWNLSRRDGEEVSNLLSKEPCALHRSFLMIGRPDDGRPRLVLRSRLRFCDCLIIKNDRSYALSLSLSLCLTLSLSFVVSLFVESPMYDANRVAVTR